MSTTATASDHREAVTVYVIGGIAIPAGETSDHLKSGWRYGGGVGFVVNRREKSAAELRLTVDGITNSQKNDQLRNKNNSFGSVAVELKLIRSTERFLRPYFLIGTGLEFFNPIATVGGGLDLAAFRDGTRPLFVEGKYFWSAGDAVKFFIVSLGIRFG
jgi:hypothetical protein